MMEDRRADARDAVEAARREAIVVLPPSTWREIQSRGVDARASPPSCPPTARSCAWSPTSRR